MSRGTGPQMADAEDAWLSRAGLSRPSTPLPPMPPEPGLLQQALARARSPIPPEQQAQLAGYRQQIGDESVLGKMQQLRQAEDSGANVLSDPNTRALLTDIAGSMDMAGPIKAYHGSPHTFTAFDSSKIGTGEGAQAYGHGLYFAESPGVAKSYQDKLAYETFVRPDGSVFDFDKLRHLNVRSLARRSGEDLDTPIAKARTILGGDGPADVKEMARQDLADLEAAKAAGGVKKVAGSLYDVTLAPEPEDLLHWDKPLSEQSPQVREKLAPVLAPIRDKMVADASAWGTPSAAETADYHKQVDGILDRMSGEKIYWNIKRQKFSAQEAHVANPNTAAGQYASQILRDAGIPGIRYADAGSRGAADKQTHNYVIFDANLAKIDSRNGQPVADALAARKP